MDAGQAKMDGALWGKGEPMDLIERQAAIKTLEKGLPSEPLKSKYTEGITVGFGLAITWIEQLPSAQPETHEECTETHACDCISRQATIDAMENVDWYHINKDGQLIQGANSKEDEPLYKAKDVYTVLNTMPSAQPEDCDTCKHGYFGDNHCDNCRVRYPSHYERRTDEA